MYKRNVKQKPFMGLSKKTKLSEQQIPEQDENRAENLEEEDPVFLPASQAPVTTQRRYFSQRSTINRSQSTTLKSNESTIRKIPSSYFENTLLRVGITTFDDPQYFVLSCDHITFVNKLRKMLKSEADYPSNIERFLNGLKTFINDESQLVKTLSVCMMNSSNSEFLPRSQECLMKNCLMIDFLEKDLIKILLEKLQELTKESNPTDQNMLSIILILNQLSFVNKIANGDLIFDKICEILENCNTSYRMEIIKHIKDILDPKQHDLVVQKLMDILGDNLINEVTVDSFESMNLSQHLQRELKFKFLHFIREKATSLKIMPVLIKFLLKFNPKDMSELPELITKIRSSIKLEISSGCENGKELIEIQSKVFEHIVRDLKRSKELADVWLKSIQHSERPQNHYPMDIIVLIIMSSVNEDRTSYLENIIRKKIKQELITPDLFQKAIERFPGVISKHLKVFFEFIDNLFRDKGELSEFGEIGYKLAFGLKNCDHKLLLSKLVAFVCEKNSPEVVSRALILLNDINKQYPSEMQTHSLQVLRILDKVTEVGLYEYRLIMDLLSSIAYPFDALPIDDLATHIDILVRKQISSSVMSVKRQGIVGSVRVIDHLVWHSNEKIFDSDVSVEEVDELKDENAKTAVSLIELMFLSVKGSPENQALCYDELSTIFVPRQTNSNRGKYLDKPFVSLFCKQITDQFQDLFITFDIPEKPLMDLDRKFCMNRDEEFSEGNTELVNMAINIGGYIFNQEEDKLLNSNMLMVLCPLFNLTRIMQFQRYNGDMVNIDALIGAPVIFPKFVDSPEDLELFDQSENEKNLKILDALFYTANWFREIICAFAVQRELHMRQKVLIRLNDLIRLEDNIRNLLKVLPENYKPPKSQFMNTQQSAVMELFKKPKAPVGRTKKKKDNQDTVMSLSKTQNQTIGNVTQNTSGRGKASSGTFLNSYGPKEIYRQLDPDIMFLLNESLCTIYPTPKEKLGNCLGLVEYKFIVEDIILKLESMTGVKKIASNQNPQFIISAIGVINDIGNFLPRLVHFFYQIFDAMKKNIDQGIDMENTLLYTDEMNCLKTCFGLTLRLWSGLCSWPGFRHEDNQKLLQKILYVLIYPTDENNKNSSVFDLAKKNSLQIMELEPNVVDLNSAVYLARLSKSMDLFSNQTNETVQLCQKLISRQWYCCTGAPEKGSDTNILLDDLLKGLFENADMKFIQKHLLSISLEVGNLNAKRDANLKSFPNFNKLNFPILFRAFGGAIVDYLTRKSETDMTTLMKLDLWEKTIECLNLLLDIVKTVQIHRNFSLFLKYSHLIIKQFLHHGMPMVETAMKSRGDRIQTLLKNLQQTTRFLHNLCCQSKAIKNAGIVAQIPVLRQTVESLTYRVKAALAANKCSSVFWLGNLKNKNLDGEEILSQVPSLTTDTGGDSENEEELPSDDETLHTRSDINEF